MGSGRARYLVAGGLAVVAALAGLGLGSIERRTPPLSHIGHTAPISNRVEVHVAGWVAKPGVVAVGEGALVVDAIEAAGGLIPGADTEALNLAAEVFDGDQVLVPGPAHEGGSSTSGLLALSTASPEELEALPGVGPVLAAEIVAYRETNGRFRSVEDLLSVPGIGESKLASLRDLVRP